MSRVVGKIVRTFSNQVQIEVSNGQITSLAMVGPSILGSAHVGDFVNLEVEEVPAHLGTRATLEIREIYPPDPVEPNHAN